MAAAEGQQSRHWFGTSKSKALVNSSVADQPGAYSLCKHPLWLKSLAYDRACTLNISDSRGDITSGFTKQARSASDRPSAIAGCLSLLLCTAALNSRRLQLADQLLLSLLSGQQQVHGHTEMQL